MRYWEDFTTGEIETFGAYEVSEDEIIAFGKAYDPLPFHIDPDAARDSPYGRLTAPGLLTCSIFMRLLVDNVLAEVASMGSPGVDSARWRQPVFVGDTLTARVTVTDKRLSKSRPELGLVHFAVETRNQDNVLVMSFVSVSMLARREPG